MIDEQDSSFEAADATRVDLGDDLLEKTAVIPGIRKHSEKNALAPAMKPAVNPAELQGGVADLFQSAKILVSEGLTEEAKRVLRQILIADAGNANARKLLDQIHEIELKQIFSEEEIHRPFRRKSDPVLVEYDSEWVIRQLDEDLKLGMRVPMDQLTLFQDPELMNSFISKLEKDLSTASIQDWIDLGIAFLEMELYSIAVRLFMGASRHLDQSISSGSEICLSINGLLALSLILADRPLEAVSRIQPLLRDAEIKLENKIELFYLMGRTYECMNKRDLAFQYYKQVLKTDPHYRDTEQRLRKEHF